MGEAAESEGAAGGTAETAIPSPTGVAGNRSSNCEQRNPPGESYQKHSPSPGHQSSSSNMVD